MVRNTVKRKSNIQGLYNALGEKRLCISVSEAAQMLGVSRNFAYELVKQHKLPVIEFGKRKLIPKVTLIKMLEQGGVK